MYSGRVPNALTTCNKLLHSSIQLQSWASNTPNGHLCQHADHQARRALASRVSMKRTRAASNSEKPGSNAATADAQAPAARRAAPGSTGTETAATVWQTNNKYAAMEFPANHPLMQEMPAELCNVKTLPCRLIDCGKFRHGAKRSWCTVHHTHYPYKGDSEGVCRMSGAQFVCLKPEAIKVLDMRDWHEVGIWAALTAGIDTSERPRPQFTGIRVHSRKQPGQPAEEGIYRAVLLTTDQGQQHLITPPAAVALLYAYEYGLKQQLGTVTCRNCGTVHEDTLPGFSDAAHLLHLCHSCGRNVRGPAPLISNPLLPISTPPVTEQVQGNPLKLSTDKHEVVLHADCPALVWKFDTPQTLGLHVRAHNKGTGALEYDDTYAEVWLDGAPVDRRKLIDAMFKAALNPSTSSTALDTVYEVPHASTMYWLALTDYLDSVYLALY